jgi:hypothetical protein
LLAPQNKILAVFSKREAGAAVYLDAMKTKPHPASTDCRNENVVRLAAYRLDPFAVDRRGLSWPQAKENDVHLDHLARRRHADGVQMTEGRPPPEEPLKERERLLRELGPGHRLMVEAALAQHPSLTARQAITDLTRSGRL